jgi:hypothetical protein
LWLGNGRKIWELKKSKLGRKRLLGLTNLLWVIAMMQMMGRTTTTMMRLLGRDQPMTRGKGQRPRRAAETIGVKRSSKQ